MTQISYPWTGTTTGDCGPYSATDISDWNYLYSMTAWAAEGVLLSDGDIDDNLEVTGSSTPVSVATGRACVRARFYENDASENFTISTPSTQQRYDRIVLRSSYSAQTIRLAKLTGTEGGSVPALTQIDGTTWEIPLATLLVSTSGTITITDEREYVHMRTMVSTDQLDDGVLSADTTGRAKMADGFLTTAKLADGVLSADTTGLAKMADAFLSADEAGRAKVADEFLIVDHFSEDIDASEIGFSAALLCGRDPDRDFYRTDAAPSTEDDEFDDGELDAKWTATGSCSDADEHDTWKSHYWIRFASAGEYRKLQEPFTPGSSQYTISGMLRYAVMNNAAYCSLAVLSSDEQDGFIIKYCFDSGETGNYHIVFMKKDGGEYTSTFDTPMFPQTSFVLCITRNGNEYKGAISYDDYSFLHLGTYTMVFVAGLIELYFYFGDAAVTSSGNCGVDWVRRDWDTI